MRTRKSLVGFFYVVKERIWVSEKTPPYGVKVKKSTEIVVIRHMN